jgi:Tol biopolymer transport system component
VVAALLGLAAEAHAAYPGANGKVIYEHKADQFASKSSVFTVSPGIPASAGKLVKFSEATYDFAYSPSGKKVAFQAEVPSQEIVVMKSNGAKPKVITKKIEKCIGKSRPTWSPDGKKIAFQCLNKRGFNQHDIWSVNADGSGLKQITTTHDAYMPRWSPLGDEIAYSTFGNALYTVPAGGGESTLLNDDPPGITGGWQRFDWAPDGQTIVSESIGDGIYLLNATTGAVISGDLANSGGEPVFSPDGTKILYVGFAESSGSELDLWMMDVNGANKTQVTSNGYDRAPNWGVAP